MTTELTKAAQQALEPMTILSDDDILRAAKSWREFDAPDGVDPVGRMIYGACRSALNEYLRRSRQSIALTQRPAVQPTPDAIREHLEGIARRACTDEQFNAFKWIIDTTFESLDLLPAQQQATPAQYAGALHLFEFWWAAHMPQATQAQAWAAWMAAQGSNGATIEAAQQATPESDDDAQIRAIGEGLRSAHDHIEMHRLERSHCKDAERIREGLAAFSAYKKRGDFAATPEPAAWLVSLPDEPELGEWFSEEDMSEKGYTSKPLFTRPAPGVPDGWRNVIAGTLKTDPWDSARVADYNSGWNDCQRKTLRGLERLAASQAKGGAA